MKKVHSHPNLAFIQHLKLILENHGISCAIKNEFLQAGVGELPPNEVWPELWIHHENLLEEATALIQNVLSEDHSEGPSWKCKSCNEEIEPQFTECWRCGESRT